MRITPLFAPLIAFVLSPAVRGDGISGIEVAWYTDRSCNVAPGLEYRNVLCNSCIDPLFYWFSVKLSGLGRNNRVTIHDQDHCTSTSLIGQFYGDRCAAAPGTRVLRSVWVGCPGQAVDTSNTASAASNISYISYKGDANDTSVTGDAGDANNANV